MGRAIRSGARRWINRAPIGLRAVAAVGVLLGLAVVTIGLSAALIFDQHEAREDSHHPAVPVSSAISTASLHAKGAANDERGFLLTGDRMYLDQFHMRVGVARDAFDQATASAVGAEIRYIDQARDGFERWVAALDTEFALFQDGDRTAAIDDAVGANRDLRKSYEAALAQAQVLADQAVDQGASAVDGPSSWTAVILAILAIALVGGCFVAAWLVRSVIVPLNALVNVLSGPDR
ncbi:MAG: CHASE3 domain-containing protein [Nocardioidaceae bacterium]